MLHHIDDDNATGLLTLLRDALLPGGRVMTLDGCYVATMSRLSRFFLDHDRGRFVRDRQRYVTLASGIFANVSAEHRTDLFSIPYDALVMLCQNTNRQE